MSKTLQRWWAGATWLVAATAAAASDNPLCPEPLQIGYYEFGAHYQPATGAGLDVDVIDELLRRVGCKGQAHHLSRIQTWHRMAEGRLDITPSALETPERRVFADFLPYFQTRNQAVLRRGTVSTATEFAADASLRFGVVRAFRHGAGWDEWIEALKAQGRVVEASDTRSLLTFLEHGRIDGFPALPSVMAVLLKEPGRAPPLWSLRPWFAKQPVNISHLALQRERVNPRLREQMAQALEQMRRDGTLERIFARHLDSLDDVRMMLLP